MDQMEEGKGNDGAFLFNQGLFLSLLIAVAQKQQDTF